MGFNLMPVKSLNATHHGALPLSEEEVKNSVSFCAAGMSVKKKIFWGFSLTSPAKMQTISGSLQINRLSVESVKSFSYGY